MTVGPDFQSIAAQALLGSSRTRLAPAVMWLGWRSTSGTELSTQRVAVANDDSVWGPTESGVSNVAPIDGGPAGAWIIGGAGWGQVALAWQIARPGITAPIASATSLAQWQELARAATLVLDADTVAELDRASAP